MSFPLNNGRGAAPPIQFADEATTANGCKVLIYGMSGMGKTRLVASAPAPLLLSAERGELSLRKVYLDHGIRVPIWRINALADLEAAYAWVTTSPDARQFQTFALDSISEITEVILDNEKKTNKDPRKAYGESQDRTVELFRKFRDLAGPHVIFIAKQEFQKDESGARFNAPSFPGNKLAQLAPYFFDEVFQLQRGKTPEGVEWFALRTRPDNQNQAKDRSGMLDEWENADPATGGGLTYIFNKMQRIG